MINLNDILGVDEKKMTGFTEPCNNNTQNAITSLTYTKSWLYLTFWHLHFYCAFYCLLLYERHSSWNYSCFLEKYSFLSSNWIILLNKYILVNHISFFFNTLILHILSFTDLFLFSSSQENYAHFIFPIPCNISSHKPPLLPDRNPEITS